MIPRRLAIGARPGRGGPESRKLLSGWPARRSIPPTTRDEAGGRQPSRVLEQFVVTSRLDCRRCATSETLLHRTFNDNEEQVAMTQGRDAIHHAHGGGTEDVVFRVLP